MKRGIKLCLGLAGTLFVLGLALYLTGSAMGGRRESDQYYEDRWEDFSLGKAWGPILVNSDGVHIGGENGVHVDSDGVSVGGENGIRVGHYGDGKETGEKQILESGTLEGISSVEVDVDCGDLWVQEGEEFAVSLSWNLRNYSMSYQVENGTLKVEDKSWGGVKWGDNFNVECKMILTVPAGTALDALDLSTAFGDIEVDAALTAVEADLSTNMGDVVCRNLRAGELDAKSDMGDVLIHLPGGREEYTWELETSMGALTVDGQTQNSGLGDIATQGGYGPNSVEAETSMGDIQVYFSK